MPPLEPPEQSGGSSFDFGDVDYTGWECFGTIEPDHHECSDCPGRVDCAHKAGVQLREGK